MHLPPSLNKCHVLQCSSYNPLQSYFSGPHKLREMNFFADRGVSADDSFSDHIATVTKKGRHLMGLCARSLSCQDAQFMTRVHSTYILPVLNYAPFVWSPYLRQEINKIESVQRKFTKRIGSLRYLIYDQRLFNRQSL